MFSGRSRVRLSRMDAAVDAMLPYGFPEEKVKKHVKELLKVYGGNEGWPFVEEYAYKVLIDYILEAKDDEEQVVQNGYDLLEISSSNFDTLTESLVQDRPKRDVRLPGRFKDYKMG